MTKLDWENITNYIDSVGITDTIFPFVKVQSSVKVTASGARDNIIYTIGTQSGTLTPGQSVTVTGSISSMTLRAASGRQPFQVWATEAGTEKEQADTSYQGQIDSLTTSLDQKASQTDLDTANANISKKADKTYADQIQTQVNNIVVGSGNSNAEVSQAHDIFPTLNDRITNIQNAVMTRTNNLLDISKGISADISIQNWGAGSTTYNNTYAYAGRFLYPIIGGIVEGKTYKVYDSNGIAQTAQNFGWYDQNGIALSFGSLTPDGLPAPTGAKFARFGALVNTITQFKEASINPVYEPFGYQSTSLKQSDLTPVTNRISVLEQKTTVTAKPKILFIFDEGAYDNRAQILNANGMKGTFGIGADGLATNQNFFQDHIKKLVQNGNDLGLYAGAGTRPTLYTDANAYTNWKAYIKNGVDQLNAIGLYYPTQYCCANHKASQVILQACTELGFKYVSSAYTLVNGEDWSDPSTIFNSVSTNAPNKMGMAPYTMPSRTYADIKNQIDSAVTNNYVLPLFTHMVIDGTPGTYDMTLDIFNQVVAYVKSLKDSGKVDVLTLRELYNQSYQEDGRNLDFIRTMSAVMDNKKFS